MFFHCVAVAFIRTLVKCFWGRCNIDPARRWSIDTVSDNFPTIHSVNKCTYFLLWLFGWSSRVSRRRKALPLWLREEPVSAISSHLVVDMSFRLTMATMKRKAYCESSDYLLRLSVFFFYPSLRLNAQDQWFSTDVPWHTGVPWGNVKCAVECWGAQCFFYTSSWNGIFKCTNGTAS